MTRWVARYETLVIVEAETKEEAQDLAEENLSIDDAVMVDLSTETATGAQLFVVTARVAELVRADSPVEAVAILEARLDDAGFQSLGEADAFVSEPAPELGWDGERFTDQ